MEQSDKGEFVKFAEDTWEADADAFVPRPAGYLKLGGRRWPILSFVDIPIKDSIRCTQLSEDILRAETLDERMGRAVEQVLLLSDPRDRIPRETLETLTPHQITVLCALATRVARVPLAAGAEKTATDLQGSEGSSPASAGSSGGANGTSSS